MGVVVVTRQNPSALSGREQDSPVVLGREVLALTEHVRALSSRD